MIQEIKSGGDETHRRKEHERLAGHTILIYGSCMFAFWSLFLFAHGDPVLGSRALCVSFASWYTLWQLSSRVMLPMERGRNEEEAGDGGRNCSF